MFQDTVLAAAEHQEVNLHLQRRSVDYSKMIRDPPKMETDTGQDMEVRYEAS